MNISSAFNEILRAERVLCAANSSHSDSGVNVKSTDTHNGRERENEDDFGRSHGKSKISPKSLFEEDGRDVHKLLRFDQRDFNHYNYTNGFDGHDGKRKVAEEYGNRDGDQITTKSTVHHSPHASICGKHPAIRIYRREGKSGNNSMNSTEASRTASSSNTDDAIVIKSYEAMRSNVSMLSNVTTDHAAPIFLKEIAPAVYSSLLPFPSYSSSSSLSDDDKVGDRRELLKLYRSSSIPIYRLYSHPLPKINYTNEIYIERGYLGATMIVLYMLITTIVSVRAVTQLRKNGVKLQLHIAGKCNSLFEAFVATMLGTFLQRDRTLPRSIFFFSFAC